MSVAINIAFEDALSQAVILRILQYCGDWSIGAELPGRGFGYLKKNIGKYNLAGENGSPFFVLTDLDSEMCPNALITNWLSKKKKSKNLLFRVAVREVEAWLLADRKGVSRLLSIQVDRIPIRVEDESNPKQALVRLARSSSSKAIRDDLVPTLGSTAEVGKNYNGRLIPFVASSWNIEEAVQNSASLARAVQRTQELQSRLATE